MYVHALLLCGEWYTYVSLLKVRDIHLSPEPFSVENNILTPTFKLKRPEGRAVFKEVFTKMYENLE